MTDANEDGLSYFDTCPPDHLRQVLERSGIVTTLDGDNFVMSLEQAREAFRVLRSHRHFAARCGYAYEAKSWEQFERAMKIQCPAYGNPENVD